MDIAIPDSLHSISALELAASLGVAASPMLLDVRRAPAYDAAAITLPGALRCAPDDVGAQAERLRGKSVVAFCVHGHEVSQNAAHVLRTAGIDAQFLSGGIEGWREAGLPVLGKLPDCGVPAAPGKPSRWMTRERPKIDRIACPWLIHRFIDRGAEFFYVPAEQVAARAAAAGAIPYDVPDVRFSHRGDECSFDALIADFGLRDDCLDALAKIVRGADTGKLELTPQSAGLLAISRGLSVTHPDDHAMLATGMLVYDALYAWLKAARNEVQNTDLFTNTK